MVRQFVTIRRGLLQVHRHQVRVLWGRHQDVFFTVHGRILIYLICHFPTYLLPHRALPRTQGPRGAGRRSGATSYDNRSAIGASNTTYISTKHNCTHYHSPRPDHRRGLYRVRQVNRTVRRPSLRRRVTPRRSTSAGRGGQLPRVSSISFLWATKAPYGGGYRPSGIPKRITFQRPIFVYRPPGYFFCLQ